MYAAVPEGTLTGWRLDHLVHNRHNWEIRWIKSWRQVSFWWQIAVNTKGIGECQTTFGGGGPPCRCHNVVGGFSVSHQWFALTIYLSILLNLMFCRMEHGNEQSKMFGCFNQENMWCLGFPLMIVTRDYVYTQHWAWDDSSPTMGITKRDHNLISIL